MATEIERKFLTADESWRNQVESSRLLCQGYLNDPGRASVRVRIDGEQANLNIKAAVKGAARAEYEYPIPLADARAMLAELCMHPPVEKRRHLLRHGAHLWEIDEFAGANAGLVVAEVELGAVDEPFEKPAWLGSEVTELRRYYNHALAITPYRDWPADER